MLIDNKLIKKTVKCFIVGPIALLTINASCVTKCDVLAMCMLKVLADDYFD